MSHSLSKRCYAETFGTFWLVFGGCGSAVLAGSGIGVFWLAPMAGAALAGFVYPFLWKQVNNETDASVTLTETESNAA